MPTGLAGAPGTLGVQGVRIPCLLALDLGFSLCQVSAQP